MVFSRDGRLLIVGGGDASVHIYDVASGRMVHRIVAPGHQVGSWPEVVALSPDGSQLAVGYPSGAFSLVDQVSIYGTADWKKQFDVMSVDEVEIASVAFSPDGSRLAIGEEDGTAGGGRCPRASRSRATMARRRPSARWCSRPADNRCSPPPMTASRGSGERWGPSKRSCPSRAASRRWR